LELADEQRHHRPQDIQRLPKVPYGIVCLAQIGLGNDLDVERTTGCSQGESPLPRRDGAVILAHGQERDTQIGRDPSEPLVIPQPLGKGLGYAQVVEDPRKFPERQYGIAQVEAQVDGLLKRVAALGELRQSC
jgi:hypothetical protein